MVSSHAIHYRNEKTMDELLRISPQERTVDGVPGPSRSSSSGRTPRSCARPRRRSPSAGADLIDLNMGCPVPKVCKTGAGAALIRDPDTAVAVARAAREGSGLPVTVKLRSGARTGETDGFALADPARRGGRRQRDRLPPAQRAGAPQGRAGLRARGAARRGAAASR